jgi:rhomboid family protein
MFAMPRATRTLILINVAVFLLEQLSPRAVLGLFALWPLHSPLFRPWQLITYGFLHDPKNLAHIFFNMFALFMFGRSLEYYWGARRFVIYYLVCVVPSLLFVAGYALAELFFGVTGREQGVAHFAHLGGLLGGALCILYWRGRRRFAA